METKNIPQIPGIYKFENLENGKVYIGQTHNLRKRKYDHDSDYKNIKHNNYSCHFYRALRKYGYNNFKYTILESGKDLTQEELNELEKYYIEYYDSFCNGYNSTKGGESTSIIRAFKSEQDIIDLKREIVNSRESLSSIAKNHNISSATITMLNNGKVWRYVGDFTYPLRENINFSLGENNNNAILNDNEVITIRKRYVDESLPEIYEDYKDILSFSGLKKICYGVNFKSLPCYKKRQKKWFLNGTCIDYPGLQE